MSKNPEVPVTLEDGTVVGHAVVTDTPNGPVAEIELEPEAMRRIFGNDKSVDAVSIEGESA